jgi:hypothetical protein
MQKNKDLQKDVQDATKWEPLMDATETGVNTKVGKNLKKFIYLTSLVGIGLFFNGCMAGYVATEPIYVEVSRPARPSNDYIWINGEWTWNRQSHVYVQNTGLWERPNQRRTYVSGHWQASPRGKYWVSGRYQRSR